MIREIFLCGLMAGCVAPQTPPRDQAGPSAGPRTCEARGASPAVFETITRQEQIVGEQRRADGTVAAPARFRTVTETRTLRDRTERTFPTPCRLRDGDPDFIAQIQRALQARGLFRGPITGVYDTGTRTAVQAFQEATEGLESGTLSLASARRLGLVAVERTTP